ncbi:hypothetical protein SUGI_0654290 [Cryptomeria japonica]|nr:hypothetical protein SUGI_0654290 [Cryptomeria japonica]
MAWKHSIDVGVGVNDADYSGLIVVILFNRFDHEFQINVGVRTAQLIIQKILTPEVLEVEDWNSLMKGLSYGLPLITLLMHSDQLLIEMVELMKI